MIYLVTCAEADNHADNDDSEHRHQTVPDVGDRVQVVVPGTVDRGDSQINNS